MNIINNMFQNFKAYLIEFMGVESALNGKNRIRDYKLEQLEELTSEISTQTEYITKNFKNESEAIHHRQKTRKEKALAILKALNEVNTVSYIHEELQRGINDDIDNVFEFSNKNRFGLMSQLFFGINHRLCELKLLNTKSTILANEVQRTVNNLIETIGVESKDIQIVSKPLYKALDKFTQNNSELFLTNESIHQMFASHWSQIEQLTQTNINSKNKPMSWADSIKFNNIDIQKSPFKNDLMNVYSILNDNGLRYSELIPEISKLQYSVRDAQCGQNIEEIDSIFRKINDYLEVKITMDNLITYCQSSLLINRYSFVETTLNSIIMDLNK